MGLSASQARLLSITQRLSNNELESQILSNAKIQLSTKNTLATEKYIAALDSTEMQYISYNDNGITESIALTFNSLTAYSPLKNQYNLYNAQGQLMVNEEDARNFETSNTLSEFLMKNGLDKFWADYDKDLTKFNTDYAKYEAEMVQYKKDKEQYDNDLKNYYEVELPKFAKQMEQYEADLAQYNADIEQYNKDLAAYNAALSAPNLYDIFSNAVGKSDELLAIPSTSSGLPSGLDASKGCYWSALHPDGTPNRASCYTHILGHIIDYNATSDQGGTNGPYKTTTGDNVDCSGLSNGYMDNTCNSEMQQVSDGINELNTDGTYKRLCDSNDDYRGKTGITNALEKAIADYNAGRINNTELKMWRLISDFVEMPDGSFATKSLKQKAIDLMYLSKNWGYSTSVSKEFPYSMLDNNMMVDILINFTDGDLRNLTLTPPTKPVNNAVLPPTPVLPSPPPHPEEPLPPNGYNYPVEDKEKAQWYTNLWHAMDGHDTTAQLGIEHDANASFTNYLVPDGKKTSNMDIIEATYNADGTIKEILKAEQLNKYYTVINKANATDSSWLQYMLTSGTVTMQQAALRTTGFITWEGIEFSSTSDIREVQDDTKIAKAEAEYEEAVAQIQAEDKIIDAKNKKLDTEHSALKTEIESIKNVMTKNIEKSFNAFS